MSTRSRMRQLTRAVQALPAAAPSADPPPAAESAELARELFRAVTDQLAKYQRARDQAAERPDPAQPPSPEYVAALLARPAEDVSFFDLERIARVDPARAAARWEEVTATAARDLAGGWTAARALEPLGGSAWARAAFHALRQQLRRAWPPRNGGEALLIDQLAQYETVRQKWSACWSRCRAIRGRSSLCKARPRAASGGDR